MRKYMNIQRSLPALSTMAGRQSSVLHHQVVPCTKSDSDDDLSDSDIKEEIETQELEDGDNIKPCRLPLGLDINYCRDWSTYDAFREFYQDWFVLNSNLLSFRKNGRLILEGEKIGRMLSSIPLSSILQI